MTGIVVYVIVTALIVTGASLLAIVLFGIRNLTYGKMDYLTMAILAVPVVLLAALGVLMDTWADAAIFTALILLALTAFSLLGSSIRGLLGI